MEVQHYSLQPRVPRIFLFIVTGGVHGLLERDPLLRLLNHKLHGHFQATFHHTSHSPAGNLQSHSAITALSLPTGSHVKTQRIKRFVDLLRCSLWRRAHLINPV